MKKDELIKTLRKIGDELAFDREKSEQVSEYCLQKFDLPVAHFMDIISDRVSLYDEKTEVLYFITKGIEDAYHLTICEKYFDPQEIKSFREMRYITSSFEYPFTIDCVEVEPGRQWIGKISVADLMKLRSADMIRYNKDKQRVRKRLSTDGQTTFRMAISKRSVNQISKLMEKREYIPDDLTFDIPDDVSTSFEYDENRHIIKFDYIDKLDITDGYHRYLAICKNYDQDPSFDYPMEIRITQFSVARTQQFIYQKDQKNKMTVSQSNSYNINRPSNEVVNRLNERGSGLLLAGQIGRSDGTVDFSALSDIVEYYWIKDKKKEYSNKEIAEVCNEVKVIMNGIVNSDPEYFEKYLNFKKLITYFYLVKNKGKSYDEAVAMLNTADKKGELSKIKLRNIRNMLFEQIETIDF